MRIMLSCFFFYGCHSKEQRDCEEKSITQEVCDGIDNDCDGEIDNHPVDGVMLYQDGDGDGFGSTVSISTCGAVPGFVENQEDCDDEDVYIHPEAEEVCDGVDNDCDNQIDDADESLSLASMSFYYKDADGDGFGDVENFQTACTPPSGYVSNPHDCDDSTITIGIIDLDQDGIFACLGDCDDSDPTVGATDDDADGFIACVNDCDDSDAFVFPGSAELESESACMRDADGDGYGDTKIDQCIILELFDSSGNGWSEGAEITVIRDGEISESFAVGVEDKCTDASLCEMFGGFLGRPQGYRAQELCFSNEELGLWYQEGIGFNEEHGVRITLSDGNVLLWGDMFDDSSELSTGDILALPPSSVIRGTDCDDANLFIGSGDKDGDGFEACDEEHPRDCNDDNPFWFFGAGYNELSPWDTDCLLDEDGDGYAQRTSLFEWNSDFGSCFQIIIQDNWSDGCNGSAELYVNGHFFQSFPGPISDFVSYYVCNANGIVQLGWVEASIFNVECSLTVQDSTGIDVFTAFAGIPMTIPSWGTDIDDHNSEIHE